MVLSSRFQKCAHGLSLSPSVKNMNVDKITNSSVGREVNNKNNKKTVLQQFRQSLTPSTVTNIVKSSVVSKVLNRGRPLRRREIQIPTIILTPTVNHSDDESLPFVNHRQQFQNHKMRSGSFRVKRKSEERSCPSTPSLFGYSTSNVHGQGPRIKNLSTSVPCRGNRFLETPHKQTLKRTCLSPCRYMGRPNIPPKTKLSEERNTESGNMLGIKSNQQNGSSRMCGTSATNNTSGNDIRNAVSCPDLTDIKPKTVHRPASVNTTENSVVETVYAIFAHESGKQSYTKFVRICDSVEACSSDYTDKESLHSDSFEGFQDVDLSIDPSCLSFSDDEF